MDRGQIFTLFDELENNGNVHREKIAALEKATGRNVVWYHANMGHPLGMMIPPDADMLENVISSLDLKPYSGLDLYVHTPGGLPEVAARMLRTCRSRVSSFRIVVPSQAMSAGTLLSMGADTILMGPASSLGPVDPQMTRMMGPAGPAISRSAKQYIDAYEELVHRAQEAMMQNRPPHPWMQQLKDQDASFIMDCRKAREATKRLGTEFLQASMFKGRPPADAAAVVEAFIKHGDEGTHGMPIWAEDAKAKGLAVEQLDGTSELWRAIREIHVRCDTYVSSKALAKTIVCRSGSMEMNANIMPVGPRNGPLPM
jgi:ATP-dependent protease ClpP protease subunit